LHLSRRWQLNISLLPIGLKVISTWIKTRLIYFKYSGAMVASKIRLTLTDQEQS